MAMADYTPRDWLVLCGLATLLLTWWISFGMMRPRRPVVDVGPQQLS